MLIDLLDIIKSQGLAIGGIIVIFIILLKFINKMMEASKKREGTLQNIITNHLHDFNSSLVLISQNLKEATEQHTRMTEL